MAFDWNSVGAPPSRDELEIAVLGPGFGESIVCHTGDGRWIVVDCCVDTTVEEEEPAPLKYLMAMGLQPEACVDLVVATHWHRDHVRGLTQLIKRCPNALFSCANAFLQSEFAAYLLACGPEQSILSSAKPNELVSSLRELKSSNRRVRWAAAGKSLIARTDPNSGVQRFSVMSLSPSDADFDRFLQELGNISQLVNKPKRAAVASDPNEVSMVLHLKWPDVSVLLGADMVVASDQNRGWKAALSEFKTQGLTRSEVVKVPHHGSLNAHFSPMWEEMLVADPISATTPYARGGLEGRPPKVSDCKRISELSDRSYLTAHPRKGRKPRLEAAVQRSLAEGGIALTEHAQVFGIVRLRRSAGIWTETLFPDAMKMKDAA